MPELLINFNAGDLHFNAGDLRRAMSQKELIDFIIEIDESVAAVDFTIDLIKELIYNLTKDEDIAWIADELGFKLK